jgi:hypothetical protein
MTCLEIRLPGVSACLVQDLIHNEAVDPEGFIGSIELTGSGNQDNLVGFEIFLVV